MQPLASAAAEKACGWRQVDFHTLKKEENVGEVGASMGAGGCSRGSYKGWSHMGFGKNGAKAIINKPNNREEWIH